MEELPRLKPVKALAINVVIRASPALIHNMIQTVQDKYVAMPALSSPFALILTATREKPARPVRLTAFTPEKYVVQELLIQEIAAAMLVVPVDRPAKTMSVHHPHHLQKMPTMLTTKPTALMTAHHGRMHGQAFPRLTGEAYSQATHYIFPEEVPRRHIVRQ